MVEENMKKKCHSPYIALNFSTVPNNIFHRLNLTFISTSWLFFLPFHPKRNEQLLNFDLQRASEWVCELRGSLRRVRINDS